VAGAVRDRRSGRGVLPGHHARDWRSAHLGYLLLLAVCAGSLGWMWEQGVYGVRGGTLALSGAMLVASAARLVLPESRIGMIASRKRFTDVITLAAGRWPAGRWSRAADVAVTGVRQRVRAQAASEASRGSVGLKLKGCPKKPGRLKAARRPEDWSELKPVSCREGRAGPNRRRPEERSGIRPVSCREERVGLKPVRRPGQHVGLKPVRSPEE
jgi:hypothetical protein